MSHAVIREPIFQESINIPYFLYHLILYFVLFVKYPHFAFIMADLSILKAC